jgi:hypothetical protein
MMILHNGAATALRENVQNRVEEPVLDGFQGSAPQLRVVKSS